MLPDLLQIPPTPTLLPPAPPAPITLDPDLWRLWNFAPEAVAWWNNYYDYTKIVQVGVLLMMIFFAIVIVINGIKSLTDSDDTT